MMRHVIQHNPCMIHQDSTETLKSGAQYFLERRGSFKNNVSCIKSNDLRNMDTNANALTSKHL